MGKILIGAARGIKPCMSVVGNREYGMYGYVSTKQAVKAAYQPRCVAKPRS